ncbi:Hypothetical protein A7982_05561 [Minicystis rosea]|nr:Hypothetical protein A7982_05561 [Minicystis rosea]
MIPVLRITSSRIGPIMVHAGGTNESQQRDFDWTNMVQ